jgi:hypothetical protein
MVPQTEGFSLFFAVKRHVQGVTARLHVVPLAPFPDKSSIPK